MTIVGATALPMPISRDGNATFSSRGVSFSAMLAAGHVADDRALGFAETGLLGSRLSARAHRIEGGRSALSQTPANSAVAAAIGDSTRAASGAVRSGSPARQLLSDSYSPIVSLRSSIPHEPVAAPRYAARDSLLRPVRLEQTYAAPQVSGHMGTLLRRKQKFAQVPFVFLSENDQGLTVVVIEPAEDIVEDRPLLYEISKLARLYGVTLRSVVISGSSWRSFGSDKTGGGS